MRASQHDHQALREEASKRSALSERLAAYEAEDEPARRAREALLRHNMEMAAWWVWFSRHS
jgi:hypothetical protein